MDKEFKDFINDGYTFKGDSIVVGAAMLGGEPKKDCQVKIALKSLNRHGLIAGATGTGKTKTLQVIAEQLSLKGVPSLLMDIKGDLSGLAKEGTLNEHIAWRHDYVGEAYTPQGLPVELLSLSKEKGVRLRATVSEFGPILFSKILGLNDTQSGIVSVIFKYCDDHEMPLVDLEDFKTLLKYITGEGKAEFKEAYGSISTTSVGTILRKIVEIEQQDGEVFFGEPSFDVEDLLQKNEKGHGYCNIIRLVDIQDKPKLFSTFMLSLLAEIYAIFPEEGDLDKPKLCIFIDEAHLVFKNASDALLDQIETIVKLIRSKGVGVFFITQNPSDIPDAVLSQLGLKVQHALRAFTAKDRKTIKKVAENYPLSEHYKIDEILTSLGIGEALITGLNRKGIPTPVAATLLRAPVSRMDVLEKGEIDDLVKDSHLVSEYAEDVDRKSAHEILTKKIVEAKDNSEEKSIPKKKRATTKEKSFIEKASKNTMVRQLGRVVLREVTRCLLGVLGIKKRRR